MTQQDIDCEWAELFLKNWNRAVELWDNGRLFDSRSRYYNQFSREQTSRQLEYARICCAWLIPSGFQEPHCVAQGE